MSLKFTENEKSGCQKGKKGVKRGENDENYHLRKLLFLPKNLEEWWRKSYLLQTEKAIKLLRQI